MRPRRRTRTLRKLLAALLLLLSLALAHTHGPRAHAQEENRFAVAGVDDAREVEKFLAELKDAVARDDRARVASMVGFPLRTNLRGRATHVRRKSDLLRNYTRIFNRKVKAALAEQDASGLFANWQGVMVGDGEIWFRPDARTGRLKIVTVNN